MATAYYLAAHGAHFPVVHADAIQPAAPAPSHPMLGVHHQAPHLPAAAPAKVDRADSVISPPAHGINPQQTSLFFRLPAELRNAIYESLLCGGTPTKLSALAAAPRLPVPEQTHPALLRSCKRIHAEARDLLYSTHVFHAHPQLLTQLPHLTSSARPLLDAHVLPHISRWQLTLRLDTDPRFTAQQASAAFSGAQFFELRVWQSMFDGCNAGVLRLFTGIRGVRCARVCGSVEEGLARWLEARMMMPAEEKGEAGWCACTGERYARCEGCEGRVRLDGNGAGMWVEEGDAWRFGNR